MSYTPIMQTLYTFYNNNIYSMVPLPVLDITGCNLVCLFESLLGCRSVCLSLACSSVAAYRLVWATVCLWNTEPKSGWLTVGVVVDEWSSVAKALQCHTVGDSYALNFENWFVAAKRLCCCWCFDVLRCWQSLAASALKQPTSTRGSLKLLHSHTVTHTLISIYRYGERVHCIAFSWLVVGFF